METIELIKEWVDQEIEISMCELNREMRGYVNDLRTSNEKKILELKKRGVSTEENYLYRVSMGIIGV